jgi:hypothetical protein
MGPNGLQLSVDGGQKFKGLEPAQGEAAMVPDYAQGDPRILIGSNSVLEYTSVGDFGAVKPAAMSVSSIDFTTVAFGLPYSSSNPTVVVGAETLGPNDPYYLPTVYRCDGAVCTKTYLPSDSVRPVVKLSPSFMRDGRAYAITPRAFFVSRDGARSFVQASVPSGLGHLWGIVVADGPGSWTGSILLAGQNKRGQYGALYRSDDSGRTWTALPIPLKSFTTGTEGVAISRTGRLFAYSPGQGLACSSDGGRTWAPRCAPLAA